MRNSFAKSLILNLFLYRYTSRWGKGSVPRPPQTPNFIVSLKVGDKDFTGEGSTAQAAKHAAAAKALHLLKVSLILFATKTSWYYFGTFNIVKCHAIFVKRTRHCYYRAWILVK